MICGFDDVQMREAGAIPGNAEGMRGQGGISDVFQYVFWNVHFWVDAELDTEFVWPLDLV